VSYAERKKSNIILVFEINEMGIIINCPKKPTKMMEYRLKIIFGKEMIIPFRL
jgi:hypothetical protein